MTAQGKGSGFDASVYADIVPPSEEPLPIRKTRAAVAYFEREHAVAVERVAAAEGKAAFLRQQADEAVAESNAMERELASEVESAKRQLAELGG